MRFCIFFCFFILILQTNTTAQTFPAASPDLMKKSHSELHQLMNVEFGKGNFAGVIPYGLAGREKAKLESGTQDSLYSDYTNGLGSAYHQIGQLVEAESLLLEAKNIRENLFGKEHSSYANSLNNLAALYYQMGLFDKAEVMYLESNRIKEKTIGKENEEYALALSNLGLLYINVGKYELAESILEQGRNVYIKLSKRETQNYVILLNSIATLALYMGRYEQAEQLFLDAMSIQGKISSKEHPFYSIFLSNIALIYEKTKKHEQAEKMYLEAMELKEKTLGKEDPEYATILSNLSLLYEKMGRIPQAMALSIEAKNIRAKSLGKEHLSYAQSNNNLAYLYIRTGQTKEAITLLLESQNTYLKSVGKEHPMYVKTIINLAGAYIKEKRYDEAWKTYVQAINAIIGTNINSGLYTNWTDSLKNISLRSFEHLECLNIALYSVYNLLEIQDSAKQQQEIICDIALDILKTNRDKFANEKDKLRLLTWSNDWVSRNLNVLDLQKQTDKAFEMAEMNKSVLLMEAAKNERAYQMGNLPDSLVQIEKDLNKKQSGLQAALLENRPALEKDSIRKVLNNLYVEFNAFKEKIETKYPEYAKLKYEQVATKITDIQSFLDASSALLEYVIGDSAIYIFYIDKKIAHIVERPLKDSLLLDKIQKMHHALSDYKMVFKKAEMAYREYTQTAYWFYTNLVAPALVHAKNIKNLIIVADGELGYLPFEAFLVKNAPQTVTDYHELHYLMNDYAVSYNYSAALFVEAHQTKKKNTNNGKLFAAAANYTTQLDSNKLEQRLLTYQKMRAHLAPLPAARTEVETLEKTFDGFFAFDAQASEKIFKEKAVDYGIIHLSMHGLLDNKAPILSSIAFSEDGDSVENNFLQAYEISKMKLNADLVVLSACETGYGKIEKGNGMASLARAFMYAGTPALIVSLWQVNDFATSEIMKNLYTNLANGMNKSVALRQAKMDYMKKAKGVLAHPAFWSPFVLVGNDIPIIVHKKKEYFWWILGAVGVIALGAGVWVVRRRKE